MPSQYSDIQVIQLVASTSAGGLGNILLGDASATTIASCVPVPYKCQVRRVALVGLNGSTHATVGVYAFNYRLVAGTGTPVLIATLTKTTASWQGKVLYKDVNVTSRVTLSEGSEFELVVTTANGDAFPYSAWILVERIPEVAGNNSSMIVTA